MNAPTPEFLRRPSIDLAAEEAKARKENWRVIERTATIPASILIFTPINIFAALALGIAVGGILAAVGSAFVIDTLVQHGFWPAFEMME